MTIHEAVKQGDLRAVIDRLLATPNDVNGRQPMPGLEGEQTPLHLAADNQDVEMIDVLLRHGADPNVRSGSLMGDEEWSPGETPIIFAAWRGSASVVSRLLHEGADANLGAQDGFTALHAAVIQNHHDVAAILLRNGALVDCSYYRHTHDLEFNAEYSLTPLHCAAREGLVEMCRLLLEHGADVNRSDMFGQVPLHYAARRGNTDVVRLLLHTGARTDAYGGDHITPDPFGGEPGSSPLHYAASGPLDRNEGLERSRLDPTIIELLIAHGAKINAAAKRRETPLHLAVRSGWSEGVATLLHLGANVDARDDCACTPLHDAVALHESIGSGGRRYGICAMLVANGADLLAKDLGGESPLVQSKACNDAALGKLLRKQASMR